MNTANALQANPFVVPAAADHCGAGACRRWAGRLTFALCRTLLVLSALGGGVVAQTRGQTAADTPPFLRIVNGPTHRIEPFKEGNTKEGHMYFEVVLENVTGYIVKAGASFTLYLKDGSRHSGCYASGGQGAGVYFSVAPHEKIRVQCSRSIVPIDLPGEKVTMRLWDYRRINKPRVAPVKVVEAGLSAAKEDYLKDQFNAFAFARLRSLTKTDMRIITVFRYYDAENIQVGECESGAAKIEPEAVLKIVCDWFQVTLNRKPTVVKAEVYLLQ